ncbi:MAG: MHYT domain-containing protein [Phormidesmis sp.]
MALFLPTGYDTSLVCLSILIAVLASYTALDLAGRVNATQGRSQLIWILCGAIAMGTGIWSMHFIGMLAFRVSMPVHYHFGKVLLSVLPAIVASGLALYIVSRATLGWAKLAAGSVLMGSGIAAMHYAGMMAMETEAIMEYDVTIVALSVGIAIAVSLAALAIIFKLREEGGTKRIGKKIGASLLMGAAIPTMHYTGMAAAHFSSPVMPVTPVLQPPLNGTVLASAVVIGALIVFSVAWLSAFLDRRFSAQVSYSESLQASRTKLRQRTQALSQSLAEVKSLQAQLIQSEKMSSIGQLVAGIAHEINNPVNFIHGNLTYIENYAQDLLTLVEHYQQHYPQPAPTLQAVIEDIEPEFLQEDLSKILSSMRVGTDRIRDIVLSLRNFSRMDEADLKKVDVHEGLNSTLMLLAHQIKSKGKTPAIEVVQDYDALPLLECYPGQLNQVFMNILVNAIDAINAVRCNERAPDANQRLGQLTIRTSMFGSDWVEIAIADNGCGISEETKARIFDPFFTTKPVGKGTGMGMSISYKIVVERHGGKIDVISEANQGTEFFIRLPIRQSGKGSV